MRSIRERHQLTMPMNPATHPTKTTVPVATDRLLSLRNVAARLDLSVRAVYRLMARGDLPPPVKAGGASRLHESDVSAYLERLKQNRPR